MMIRPAVFLLLILSGSLPLIASETPVDFQKQIAPLFEQHCLRCHSENNSKGDFSLTSGEDLRANEFVTPGEPDSSYLIEMVTGDESSPPQMPQKAAPISAQEVQLLRTWIQQGAHWPTGVRLREKSKADASWWAYQPLQPSEKKSIDDFIQDRLAEQGLERNPESDRRTLIRRLSFDLHGLPPRPEEVEEFVNDPDPHAYEKLVDRFLAAPQYGERFARHWLDLAHYADTHGFERDQRRNDAWRYRDYVIQAFNEDKPYDRFLQEQIAGDVLWPEHEAAVIATGFLAAGPWDFVGQVETKSPELQRSARALDLDDMATQVMTATMATTINCARCHDHKLDPISQQEYYQLQAVFAGIKRESRVISEAALQNYEQKKQELLARLNAIDNQIGRLEGKGLNLADLVGGGNGHGTGTYRQGIDARTGRVQTRDFGNLGNVKTNRFSTTDFELIDGVFIPDGAEGQAEIPISSTGLTITGLPKTSGLAWDMIRNGPVASQHSPELEGIDFTKDGHSMIGLHANAGITFDLAAIRSRLDSEEELQFRTRVGYFGASGEFWADAWIYVDGQRVAEFPRLGRADGLKSLQIPLPSSARFLTLITTDGGNGYSHDQICFTDPTIQFTTPPALSEESRAQLQRLKADREQIQQEQNTLGPPPQFYGVVPEKAVPEVRLLVRGNPEQPHGEALPPQGLTALSMLEPDLGSLEAGEGARRAALAHWITDPSNPLTRRVIVNRLWQWHFGQGIVKTASDFGYGGDRPSHPELLDWLAEELIQKDWSLKEMHRLILLSETYQQTSFSHAKGTETDAENRLLWRQNPHRLEAEAIRDAVLFVSGKLNPERGGPGFEDFEYQDAYAPIYTYITADTPALWKRSIYRYVVRTTPNRFLTTLDCPDPANLTARRLTTTTPLQSLALYNNEFMLKQAQYLAERIELETGNLVPEQVERAFELSFSRAPSEQERELATDFVAAQGLFALCRSLLNSNEFVYVD